MAPITAKLQTEELTSLRTISKASRTTLPDLAPEHREKLLGCGFAAVLADGLAITPAGQAKLVYETTRENWFPLSL